MPTAYIVDAVRTAGGRRGGRLAGVHPVDLLAKSLDAVVERFSPLLNRNFYFFEGGVVRQGDSQLEQIIFVLVIDPAQSVRIAELESPDKQLVFYHSSKRVIRKTFLHS